MFSWIPLVGPIIDGIVSIFTKYQDTKLGTLQANLTADVTDAQTSAQIIEATKDDIGLRILRDAALVFPVAWSALIGYDTLVSYRWPDYMFHVNAYPPSVEYLPYAALTFLLGNIGINAWKRR